MTRRACAAWVSTAPSSFDGGDIDLTHRHHRLERALRLAAASRKRIGQCAWGDLPGEAPPVLAPAARAFAAAIADDRVPVTVGLFLRIRRDLEGEGLAVLEGRAAVETETGNAHDRELDRQHIALLAAREIGGRRVNGGDSAVRKGGGVKARGLMGVFVEPEADGVLWLHVGVLRLLDRDELAGSFVTVRLRHVFSVPATALLLRWATRGTTPRRSAAVSGGNRRKACQRTRSITTPCPGTSAEYSGPAAFPSVWRHTSRMRDGGLTSPASAQRNVTRASCSARLNTASAVSPLASSLVRTSCWPDCHARFPCRPAGS